MKMPTRTHTIIVPMRRRRPTRRAPPSSRGRSTRPPLPRISTSRPVDLAPTPDPKRVGHLLEHGHIVPRLGAEAHQTPTTSFRRLRVYPGVEQGFVHLIVCDRSGEWRSPISRIGTPGIPGGQADIERGVRRLARAGGSLLQ